MGYNQAYTPRPFSKIKKKYAWIPVVTDNKKWIWLDHYYKIFNFNRNQNCDPEYEILSKKEYLLWVIKNPKMNPEPPTSGSAVVR